MRRRTVVAGLLAGALTLSVSAGAFEVATASLADAAAAGMVPRAGGVAPAPTPPLATAGGASGSGSGSGHSGDSPVAGAPGATATIATLLDAAADPDLGMRAAEDGRSEVDGDSLTTRAVVPALAVPGRTTRVPGSALRAFRIGLDVPARVAVSRRPYAAAGVTDLTSANRPHDAKGIVMYSRGGRLHNHPVVQASHILAWASSYRNGGGVAYRDQAVKHGERILSYAVRSRGALYFPYRFDFPLHGRKDLTLTAPWYSAMAQGEALSAFVALYEITGQPRWKAAADATFVSFLQPKAAKVPWTVQVDSSGLLWFEEYAGTHTDRAFNGHNFALFGVYDYWWLTRDSRARAVFLGGLQATRVHLAGIRVPGRTSRYCLAHDVHSESYHGIHISQLLTLYRLTGSRDLVRAADRLQADAPRDYLGGTGYLAGVQHTVVQRRADGRVASVRTVTLPRSQQVRVGRRSWVAGRPGVWLRIDSGTLKGSWVAELPRRSFVVGVRDTLAYEPARPVTLAKGAQTGYRLDASGRWVAVRTVRLTRAAAARAGGRLTRDGAVYVTMASGPMQGLSVPIGRVTLL